MYVESNELMENKDFQAHCLTVMMAVNTMIEFGLNDPMLLKSLVSKIGRSHFRRRMTSIPIEVYFVLHHELLLYCAFAAFLRNNVGIYSGKFQENAET